MDQTQADRIRRYVRRTAWFRYKLSAEIADDISQDILVLVWKLFPDALPPERWISRATHLKCLMMFRAESRRRRREQEFARRRALLAPSGSGARRERRLDLKLALESFVGASLGDDFDPGGRSLAELAKSCGLPAGTLYRRIWDFRRRRRRSTRTEADGSKPEGAPYSGRAAFGSSRQRRTTAS